MQHLIVFSGSGPILIVHTHPAMSDEGLIKKLEAKGLTKFILFELDGAQLRETYGHRYEMVINDLLPANDLRVLDYDGHRVLNHFDFAKLKTQKPFFHG